MKYTGACLLAAVAMQAATAAWAETQAEYASTPAPAAAPPRARPPLFAPEAAKTAARLPAQERADRAFIQAAAANSRFEAEAARQVLAKSADPRVRALATDLIVQHNAGSEQLGQLLQSRAMALPMMDNEHRRVLKRLDRLAGRKLDREFLARVALRHQREDLARYEKASQRTADAGLKDWVDRQLPAMREQLAVAERIAAPDSRLARGRTSLAPAGPGAGVVPATLAAQRMGAAAAAATPSGSGSR